MRALPFGAVGSWFLGVFVYAFLGASLSCGGSGNSPFGSGFDSGGGSPSMDASFVNPPGPQFGDGGVGEAAGGCLGLECQAANCAAMGKPETALTGTIFNPAGALPLYDVYVYVPATKPDPITAGKPTCSACQAAASGTPIDGRLTDANGKFTLQKGPNDTYGIPVGTNIPLVIQAGKWRRQITIPEVTACTTVDLDAMLGKELLRLPKKSSEGDLPLIALTSAGYDAFECFLRVVGVDDSEFVPPGSTAGHVHFYTGAYDDPSNPAASIAGGNTATDTFQWWTNPANLLQYDIILNGCDGINGSRPQAAYAAMSAYLNGGGRVFVTDSFEDWFGPPTGATPFETVANWQPWLSGNMFANYYADTSFPKGQAFGQWLLANGVAQMSGTGIGISLTDTYADVNAAGPTMYPGSTQWIYNADAPGTGQSSTSYLSFNTPVGTPAAQQCGRAVFSGVHVFLPNQGFGGSMQFPSECSNEPPEYSINQKALEFLFFDLSSCVQDDQQPPPPPPMTH